MCTRDPANGLCRIHETAICGHPRNGDQSYPRINHALECIGVKHAVCIVRYDFYLRAGSACHLQEGDIVGRKFRSGRENAVTRAEAQRVERSLPCDRGVLRQRDLFPLEPISIAILSYTRSRRTAFSVLAS